MMCIYIYKKHIYIYNIIFNIYIIIIIFNIYIYISQKQNALSESNTWISPAGCDSNAKSQVATWFGSKPIPSCVQSVKIPLTLDSTQAPQDTPRRWMMDEKNLMWWLSWFYDGFHYRFCLLSRKTNSFLWKNLSLMGKSSINGPCYTCSTCSMAMWFTWDCWGEEWRLHVPRRPVSFLGQLTWW